MPQCRTTKSRKGHSDCWDRMRFRDIVVCKYIAKSSTIVVSIISKGKRTAISPTHLSGPTGSNAPHLGERCCPSSLFNANNVASRDPQSMQGGQSGQSWRELQYRACRGEYEMLHAYLGVANGFSRLKDYPVPTPKRGELLLKLSCTGLCLSDVHGMLQDFGQVRPWAAESANAGAAC